MTESSAAHLLPEGLSDYKVPRAWRFLDELPRNATGKVLKRELPGSVEQ